MTKLSKGRPHKVPTVRSITLEVVFLSTTNGYSDSRPLVKIRGWENGGGGQVWKAPVKHYSHYIIKSLVTTNTRAHGDRGERLSSCLRHVTLRDTYFHQQGNTCKGALLLLLYVLGVWAQDSGKSRTHRAHSSLPFLSSAEPLLWTPYVQRPGALGSSSRIPCISLL